MFSKEITNSSEFQMMSPSAQALYFHIGMNSDDDGFCEAFTIVRMTESKPDDLRSLHEKGFIFLVDSKVCIVKDWHTNNDIRVDRYSRSKYLDKPQYADVYKTIMEEKIQHLSRYKDTLTGSTDGSTGGTTQVRLGKVSITVASAKGIKKNSMKNYNESEHADDGLPSLDLDSREITSEKPKPTRKNSPEILAVFAIFDDNPERAVWPLREIQRESAKTLHSAFGVVELRNRYSTIKRLRTEPFCPQINSPSDMLKKMPAMEKFLKDLET